MLARVMFWNGSLGGASIGMACFILQFATISFVNEAFRRVAALIWDGGRRVLAEDPGSKPAVFSSKRAPSSFGIGGAGTCSYVGIVNTRGRRGVLLARDDAVVDCGT